MNWKEKLAESKSLYARAKSILENPEATAEEKATIEDLMTTAEQLRKEGVQLRDLEMTGAELDAVITKTQNDVHPTRPEDGSEFKSVGDMLTAITMWSKFNQRDSRLRWYSDEDGKAVGTKDMAEAVGASGGFLVPTEYIARLLSVMAESNFVRQRATVIPMRRRSVGIPVLDQTGTTAGQPHWFGGMQFYWAEEAAEKTETDAAFRKIMLTAHKLIGYTRASDELVDDSAISLDALLTGEMGFVGGANWMEEYAFLQGTGEDSPLA